MVCRNFLLHSSAEGGEDFRFLAAEGGRPHVSYVGLTASSYVRNLACRAISAAASWREIVTYNRKFCMSYQVLARK